MDHISRDRAAVHEILSRSLNLDKQLPDQIFSHNFKAFLFFDSDWMFDCGFVKSMQPVMRKEGSTTILVRNIDRIANSGRARSSFFIEQSTSPDAYQQHLAGENGDHASSWLIDFGRFACCSGSGKWCIYAERSEEIAIIGFGSAHDSEVYASLLKPLKPVDIEHAIALEHTWAFGEHGMTKEWRDRLLSEYGSPARKTSV